uniref:Dynein regulatory complex protein 1 n=1 Tax=Scophthalmus maximus TaxID=52904 RepID=A0A8D3BXD6_SCOMX
ASDFKEWYLTTPVTNIQTAADARESMRRKELELEWLENDVRSSQEKFEEITKGWSMAKDKVTPRELQEALSGQQQLCALLVENKKKLINDLQQELKVGDDRYVKDLRKQVEELDLMMERMEDQVKTLTKAYREELAQLEVGPVLALRKKKVEEYEAKIHSLMLETIDKQSVIKTEETSNFQVCRNSKYAAYPLRQALQAEKKNLVTNYMSQVKQFRTKSRHLSKDHKRNIQQYERIQKTKKHFAVADARRFDEMWLTLEEEVRQLVERALVIDQRICERHLGLAWERPALPSSPFQPKKPARTPDPQPEARLSTEMKGFLMEDQLLKMLAPLEKQGPTSVKLGSLLSVSSAAERVSIRTSTFDQAAAVETNSDLIHPNHVLPALKSFLKQHMKSSVPPTEARDSSTDGAYWELTTTHAHTPKRQTSIKLCFRSTSEVLQEISELVPETDRLEQQNAELRMLLQQSLNQ